MRNTNRRYDLGFRVAIKVPTFQFTLARLLGAIGLLSAALSLFSRSGNDDTGFFICIGLIAMGSAVGQLFGKPIKGALIVVSIFVATVCLTCLLAALI
jgi:hypothetical protein